MNMMNEALNEFVNYLRNKSDNMYYIKILDTTTNRNWKEKFDSYYLFRKRVIKLKYSNKLMIISRSLLEKENKYENESSI